MINFIKTLKLRYLFILLILQIFFLVVYLNTILDPFRSQWDRLMLQQFGGDEPSYILFPFDSIRSILDNYRTIGFPLLIRLYIFIFHGYQYWPYFQFAVHAAAILFLFWALTKAGFDKILSFIMASLLIWNIDFHENMPWLQFYRGLSYFNTEVMAISFLYVVIGIMLLAIRYYNWKIMALFSFLLFILYQVRPNLMYMVFLAPFWALVCSLVVKSFSNRNPFRVFSSFFLASIIPLLLLGALRFFVLGQFGFSTMSGANLAAQATYFLDERNVQKLTDESKVIGENILRWKRKIHPPCNAAPFSTGNLPFKSLPEAMSYCNARNIIGTLDETIKYESGKEPSDNPAKNLEPWSWPDTSDYMSLFYSYYYHLSADKLLMKYGKVILSLEWRGFLDWIWQSGIYGMKLLFSSKKLNIFFGIYSVIIILMQITIRKGLFGKLNYGVWAGQLIAFSFIGITNFIAGYLGILVFVYPYDRMYITLIPFLFPTFILWAIPPFWLRRNS